MPTERRTRVDEEALKRDRQLLLDLLREAGCRVGRETPDQIQMHCGFHDDRTPSAEMSRTDEGHWVYRCYSDACGVRGSALQIMARMRNMEVADVLRDLVQEGTSPYLVTEDVGAPTPRNQRRQPRQRSVFTSLAELNGHYNSQAQRGGGTLSIFPYRDPETGYYDFIAYRIDYPDGRPKGNRQGHQSERGFVAGTLPRERRFPLYNRRGIAADNDVIFVEGEPTAVALYRLGYESTTTAPNGSSLNKTRVDFSPLAGKNVYLWPDNDDPDPSTGVRAGSKHMREVAAQLFRLDPPCNVFWIDPEAAGCPAGGGDAVDLLHSLRDMPVDHQRAWINDLLGEARRLGVVGDMLEQQRQIATGEVYCVPFPWVVMTHQTQALLPGKITVLCGSPGASKSFAALQIMRFIHGRREQMPNERGAYLALEDDETYHLWRALAQRHATPGLTNFSWRLSNDVRTRQLLHDDAEFIASFYRDIHMLSEEDPSSDAALDWLREMGRAGRRVAIIDPFSLLAFSDKPWVEDAKFMRRAGIIGREYGISPILITHPRKHAPRDVEEVTLDDVASSAFIGRFCSSALWLHAHDLEDGHWINREGQRETGLYNRTIKILKSRNAVGRYIAFRFRPEDLTLEELGVLQ